MSTGGEWERGRRCPLTPQVAPLLESGSTFFCVGRPPAWVLQNASARLMSPVKLRPKWNSTHLSLRLASKDWIYAGLAGSSNLIWGVWEQLISLIWFLDKIQTWLHLSCPAGWNSMWSSSYQNTVLSWRDYPPPPLPPPLGGTSQTVQGILRCVQRIKLFPFANNSFQTTQQ